MQRLRRFFIGEPQCTRSGDTVHTQRTRHFFWAYPAVRGEGAFWKMYSVVARIIIELRIVCPFRNQAPASVIALYTWEATTAKYNKSMTSFTVPPRVLASPIHTKDAQSIARTTRTFIFFPRYLACAPGEKKKKCGLQRGARIRRKKTFSFSCGPTHSLHTVRHAISTPFPKHQMDPNTLNTMPAYRKSMRLNGSLSGPAPPL